MARSVLVNDAPTVWKLLNGVFCIYKPAGISCHSLRKTITSNIASELCEMKCREPGKYVSIEGEDTTKPLMVQVRYDYADDPLVVGPRYQMRDLKCMWATPLGYNTSGLMLFGVGEGIKLAHKLHNSYPIRTYRVKGALGCTTDTYFKYGKVTDRSKYDKINRAMLERWCASFQASHQSRMFDLSGVDIQSQAAYEMAVKGLIRPSQKDVPLLYGIKCVEFKPPDFTLEIQCVNEYEMYLMTLIHELGYKLHPGATCTGIQCIRHTVFNLEDAVLRKHWRLLFILDSLGKCRDKLKQYRGIIEESSHIVNVTEKENVIR